MDEYKLEIYCDTITDVEKMVDILKNNGINITMFKEQGKIKVEHHHYRIDD